MGHNIVLTPYAEIPVVDEYLEFPVRGSRAVSRIAINRVTRQLVAVFTSSDAVYCYDQLSQPLQEQIEDGAASVDDIMTAVKEACAEQTIASFPDTVLVKPENAIVPIARHRLILRSND